MLKYFKIIYLFWTTSISAEMEYRLNFVLAALTSLGNLAGSLFGLFLFYRTGYNFKGWNAEEALIVVGIFTFFQGFSGSFLTPNLNKIVTQVQSGTLDFVLLKPISSQFWLSTRTVSPWGLTDIIFSLILIIYSGSKLSLPIINYLFSLIPLTFGMIILYSLWFMLGTTSIWF
ncbi:MAG TPA: ABC-2 family transporter protein, partial [Allocoleopsis sp.]